mgnify:CR=1 FL=1
MGKLCSYVGRNVSHNMGAATHEARIYWDAGTGEVDLTEPHATVPMNNPAEAARFTWQSEPLTDGQTYRFTIRVATASWPEGLETRNTGATAATADSSTPTAPVLTTQLV